MGRLPRCSGGSSGGVGKTYEQRQSRWVVRPMEQSRAFAGAWWQQRDFTTIDRHMDSQAKLPTGDPHGIVVGQRRARNGDVTSPRSRSRPVPLAVPGGMTLTMPLSCVTTAWPPQSLSTWQTVSSWGVIVDTMARPRASGSLAASRASTRRGSTWPNGRQTSSVVV
jgi:hypothetical protein